jgi:hypothetical protein
MSICLSTYVRHSHWLSAFSYLFGISSSEYVTFTLPWSLNYSSLSSLFSFFLLYLYFSSFSSCIFPPFIFPLFRFLFVVAERRHPCISVSFHPVCLLSVTPWRFIKINPLDRRVRGQKWPRAKWSNFWVRSHRNLNQGFFRFASYMFLFCFLKGTCFELRCSSSGISEHFPESRHNKAIKKR